MKYQIKNNKNEQKMFTQNTQDKEFILFPEEKSSQANSPLPAQEILHTKIKEEIELPTTPTQKGEKETIEEKDLKEINDIDSNKIIIGTFEQAPDFLQDNEFIKKGYRINCNNVTKILKSLFMFHNETVNIWTHLLGFFLSIGLIIYTIILVLDARNDMSNLNFKNMVLELKGITSSWTDGFEIIQEKSDSAELLDALDNLKKKTGEFFKEVSKKINIYDKLNEYASDMKTILSDTEKLISDLQNKEIFDKVKEGWETVQERMFEVVDLYGSGIGEHQKRVYDGIGEDHLSVWPLFIMILGSIFCLGCSSTYHLFMPLSKKVNAILSRLDYAGVTILIAGSCFPPYYYFFYCEKRKFYL